MKWTAGGVVALSVALLSCTAVPVSTHSAPTGPVSFSRTLVLAEGGDPAAAAALGRCEAAVVALIPELHPVSFVASGVAPPPAKASADALAAWADGAGADAVLAVTLEGVEHAVGRPVGPVYTRPADADLAVPLEADAPALVVTRASVRADLFSVREKRVVWSALAHRVDAWPPERPSELARGLARQLHQDGLLPKR